MMKMHACINFGRTALVSAAMAGLSASINVHAGALSLASAEAMASEKDPSVQSVKANGAALAERAIAAGQMPDPMLRLGLAGLPIDSFNLGQEPMTQVQFGIVQKFPRGHTRSLLSDQFSQRSRGLVEMAEDQKLRVVLAVREEYLEVLKQIKLAEINDEAIAAFADLADITQDYYATGRVQQQDVLRASVELAKVQDRAVRIFQEEDGARARLAAWIGEAALGEILADWPELPPLSTPDEIIGKLARHPRLRALNQNVIASETGVELAQQAFKPEFALDVTYGGRGGANPDGRQRSDLLSVMLVMDVPLFTGKRQDRIVASRVAESSAAMFGRDDVYRQMRSQIELHAATMRREQERLELFQSTLLPEAGFNAEAAFEAYQAAVVDLTTLMRARITEFELQLEFARVQAETLKTQARLVYLEGDSL